MKTNKKRILVSGGLGFIGSNLVDMLAQDPNNEIYVLDNICSDSSSEKYMREDVTYIIEDIRNINNSEKCPWGKGLYNEKQHKYINLPDQFDVIYHLAALARIQPSFERPLETISIDAMGTAEVCEFARKIKSKIVYAGSSSVYGGVYENPYAFAKWNGEEICKLYSMVYKLPTAICRFFNVYGGPRQPRSGPYATVVGIFEEQYSKGIPLTITWKGNQRRDFTHVSDICSGLIACSKKDWFGEVFNLGTGKNHSINELASMFDGAEREYIPQRPGEALETLADITKTTVLTGWVPTMELESYVSELVSTKTSI